MTKYETMCDTYKHKQLVNKFMNQVIQRLGERAINHDNSKLEDFEADIFAQHNSKLADCTYGSEEDKKTLEELKDALDHHYAKNRHHPQHWPNGIKDMDLVDLIEMICDWLAASKKHDNGNIYESLEKNQKRFRYSDNDKNFYKTTSSRIETLHGFLFSSM